MRKTVFAFLLFTCLSCSAGKITILNDSLDCLRGQDSIGVSMEYSKAIYNPKKTKYDSNGNLLPVPIMKGDDIKVYLKKCRRTLNWEKESLEYFCEWFNDEQRTLTACLDNKNVRYEIVIRINEVYKNGNISATIDIKDIKANESKSHFEFKSSDGDAEDKITFRDPMKDAGETISKTLKKLLKLK